MKTTGIAISLDILFSLLLVSGALLFFAQTPFVDSSQTQIALKNSQLSMDVFESLNNSGFLSSALVDTVFTQESVEAIHQKAVQLLPKETQVFLKVSEYGLNTQNGNIACKDDPDFDSCFTQLQSLSFGPTPPSTGAVKGKKVLIKYRPKPDIASPQNACVPSEIEFEPIQASDFGIHFDSPEIVDFNSNIYSTTGDEISSLSCDETAILNVKARNDAREPIAVELVMDRSLSMQTMDIEYKSNDTPVLGGTCQKQIKDVSDHNNNGNNFNVLPGPGKVGNVSANLSGSTYYYNSTEPIHYIEAPNDLSIDSNFISMAAWVYPTNYSNCGASMMTSACLIMGKDSDFSMEFISSGKVILYFNADMGSILLSPDDIIPLNTWTHLAVTYDNSGVKFFVDGVPTRTWANPSWHHVPTTGKMYVGDPDDLYYGAWTGNIDDVRLYRRGLSEAEVSDIKNNIAPTTDSLMLQYDFEDLNADQNVDCFFNRAFTFPSYTTCAASYLGYMNGEGISSVYTDFAQIGTLNITNELLNQIQSSSGYVFVQMEDHGPSGACKAMEYSFLDAPPYLRARQTGAPWGYFIPSDGNILYRNKTYLQSNLGVYNVSVWNGNSDPWNNDPVPVYAFFRDSIQTNANISVPATPTSPEYLESKGPITISTNQNVPATTFETCSTIKDEWTEVGRFTFSSTNRPYYLSILVTYSDPSGCVPHTKVQRPNGSDYISLTCASTACSLTPYSYSRESGSSVPEGEYIVYVRSDNPLNNVSTGYTFHQYLADAPASSLVSSASRRCTIQDSWTEVASLNVSPDMNIFEYAIDARYAYTNAYCLPEFKVVDPNNSVTWTRNCPTGSSASCNIFNFSGELPFGQYTIWTRGATAFTYLYTTQRLDNKIATIKEIDPNPGDPNFVGGGTCSNGPCVDFPNDTEPYRTNCPYDAPTMRVPPDSAISNGKTFSTARNRTTIDSLIVSGDTPIRRLKIDVNTTNTAIPYSSSSSPGVCGGPAVGFLTPMPGEGINRQYVDFPTTPVNTSRVETFTILQPLVNGQYELIGWREGADFDAYNQGRLAYWKMDDNVSGSGQSIMDSSGNGRDGLTVGNVDCTQTGITGKGCAFGGSSDYVNFGDIEGIENQMTIAFWVQGDWASSAAFLEKGTGANTEFKCEFTSRYVCTFYGETSQATVEIPGANEMMAIVLTFDGTDVKMYKNGVLLGYYPTTVRLGEPLKNSSAPLRFGKVNNRKIDEVTIWNRALSPLEASTHAILHKANFTAKWYLERLDYAKIAAKSFVNGLSWKTQDQLGLVHFGTDVTEAVPLTNNRQDINDAINGILASGETATGEALYLASQRLAAPATPANKHVILLSDGKTNVFTGHSVSEAVALARDQNIHIHTIGFGNDINRDELIWIASQTNGEYYDANDFQQLLGAFQDLVYEVQTSTGLSNVRITVPEGVEYSNPRCRTSAGTSCTGIGTLAPLAPDCECEAIETDPITRTITFRKAQVKKPAPQWWDANINFTVPCDGAYCVNSELTLPPLVPDANANSELATIDGLLQFPWTIAGQTTIDLIVRNLAVQFGTGEVTQSGTANITGEVANVGNETIDFPMAVNGQVLDATIRSCSDPAQIFPVGTRCDDSSAGGFWMKVFKNDPDNGGTLACAECVVPPIPPHSRSLMPGETLSYFLTDLPLGDLYATISPQASITECQRQNKALITCETSETPAYYLIEYWAWKE